MTNRDVFNKPPIAMRPNRESAVEAIHPAWRALISYCAELQHGEIGTLKIQDGLPVLAEVIKKKIKFG